MQDVTHIQYSTYILQSSISMAQVPNAYFGTSHYIKYKCSKCRTVDKVTI